MEDKNYINIQGWMINKMKLKGNELIFVQKRTMYSAMRILRCRKIRNKFTCFFWNYSFEFKELFFNSYDQLIIEALKFKAHNDNVSFKLLFNSLLLHKIKE